MKYASKISYQIENKLFYLLEIIRREFALKTNYKLSFEILKIVYLRLITHRDNQIKNEWRYYFKKRYFNKKNVTFLLDEMSFSLRKYNQNNNNLFESNFLFNEIELPIIQEIIELLINLEVEEIDEIDDLSLLYYNFSKKLFQYTEQNFVLGFSTDEVISNFISEIVEIKETDRIIDPFIGTGRLLYEVIEKSDLKPLEIFIQDVNQNILEMSSLLLNSCQYNNLEIKLGDSISYNSLLNSGKNFNLVITHIPIIKNNYKNYEEGELFSSNFTVNSMEQIIQKLTHDGKAYLIVPHNVLFSRGEAYKYRKKLIEMDLIETIVEFGNRKKNRSIWALIVINKKKSIGKKGIVQLLKYEKEREKEIYNDYFKNKKSDLSSIVSTDEILKKDYILTFSHYSLIFEEMFSLLTQESAYKLKEITSLCKPISSKSINASLKEIPFIKIRDLKKAIYKKYLEFEKIDLVKPLKEGFIIKEKSVIISLIGNDLKPTIFDPEKSKYKGVLLSNNCVGLTLKNNNMNIEYLYDQLYSLTTSQQLEGFSRGSHIKRIIYSDLMSIVVMKPEFSKKLQINKHYLVSQTQLEHNRLKYEEQNRNIEQDIINAENKIVNMLIHNVGKHVSQIGHKLNKIEKIMIEKQLLNEVINQDEVDNHNKQLLVKNNLIPPLELLTIRDLNDQLKSYIKSIETIFSDTQKTVNLKLNKEDFIETSLLTLLQEIKKERKCNINSNYSLIIKGVDVILKIHKQTFKEMINMLLDNAEVHAFQDVSIKNYEILFNVKQLKNKIVLEYSNNGNKFILSKKEFVLAGRKRIESTGTGQGGAYVNRVTLAHNGDFVIKNINKGTKFIFTFNLEGKRND